MSSVNVSIQHIQRHLEGEIVDGTTKKTVEFNIYSKDHNRRFRHAITDGSRLFDEQIARLEAHGAMTFEAKEYQGSEPSLDWKEEVARLALEQTKSISWEGVCKNLKHH